jgi:hypothetical protein
LRVIEFTASGSAKVISRAIEEYARAQGHVTALVVPWQSDAARLSMSVTSVKSDGWAIEHTDLGTITLTAEGDQRTRVAVAASSGDAAPEPKLAQLFDRFAHQLQEKFAAAP